MLRCAFAVPTVNGSVLIVEDDDTIRRLLAEYLKHHAHVNVDGARDGVEALHRLSQRQYAVVILDLMMPKMSGTDVIDSVKARMSDPWLRELKRPPAIIVMTAVADAELPAGTLVQRCTLVRAVFRKPLDVVALGESVEQFLREGGTRS